MLTQRLVPTILTSGYAPFLELLCLPSALYMHSLPNILILLPMERESEAIRLFHYAKCAAGMFA